MDRFVLAVQDRELPAKGKGHFDTFESSGAAIIPACCSGPDRQYLVSTLFVFITFSKGGTTVVAFHAEVDWFLGFSRSDVGASGGLSLLPTGTFSPSSSSSHLQPRNQD